MLQDPVGDGGGVCAGAREREREVESNGVPTGWAVQSVDSAWAVLVVGMDTDAASVRARWKGRRARSPAL